MTSGDLLKGLTDSQRQAVTHAAGPLLVLAGPGTGKTRVITRRVAHLVLERGVRPESILAVTYTVKAARQLREKLAELIGPRAEGVMASTFHGLGMRIVREFAPRLGYLAFRDPEGPLDARPGRPGQIVDSAQQRRLLREILLDRGLLSSERARGVEASVDHVARALDALSNAAIGPRDLTAFLSRASAALEFARTIAGAELDAAGVAAQRARLERLAQVGQAIEAYKSECRRRGWLSFDDLILLPIELMRDHAPSAAIIRDRWRHLVVDEFQDVNAAQIRLLESLSPPQASGDVCVVGDDDQSIYEFRGADDRAFARFARSWTGATEVRLAENFRSSPRIVAVTGRVIAASPARFAPDKRVVAAGDLARAGEPGPPVEAVHLEDDKQDGEVIAAMILLDRAANPARRLSEYAVVARSHGDLDRVRLALELEGIPALIARPPSPEDDEGVRDVLAWVQAVAEPRSTAPVVRLLVRPAIGEDLRRVIGWERAYRAERSRCDAGDPGTPDPGGFIEFLEARLAHAEPSVRRLAQWWREILEVSARSSARQSVDHIVRAIDAAHADLPEPRARASRVVALINLLNFVSERQDRLEAPGDLVALWRYYQDLSPQERQMRVGGLDDRVEGSAGEGDADADPADAVRLITAHSAKGLEFDTVFVPRVSPGHGYPTSGASDDLDLPAGLIERDGPEDGGGPGDGAGAPDAAMRRMCEERRVFYVACTRAERRLVLMARKTKSASKSTHFLQEIIAATTRGGPLHGHVSIVESQDVLAKVAGLGLGIGLTPALPGMTEATGRRERVLERRRAVFEAARRDVRLAAAGLLARVDRPDVTAADVDAASDELAKAAARIAALASAQAAGAAPAWAEPAARALVDSALKRSDAAADGSAGAGPGGPGGPGGIAWPKAPLDLSFSSISAYLNCPRCFLLTSVMGLSADQGAAQAVGIAVHNALEQFFRLLRDADTGEAFLEQRPQGEAGVDLLVRLGRDAFFRAWPRDSVVDRAQIEQVEAQLRLACDGLGVGGPCPAGEQILELEKTVRFDYQGHRLTARIDRIDQITLPSGRLGYRVIDYKSGYAAKNKLQPAADDLQLGIYARALAHLFGSGDPAADGLEGYAEYWLLSTGQRGVIPLSQIRHDKVAKVIDQAIEGMLGRRFDAKVGCEGPCAALGIDPAGLA
jgi:DNA helicase-2/ATP-dependent DNA helicase PcrA